MNTSWEELKDTLLKLYRRCYEYDFKYILYYLLHINSVLDWVSIIHKMLSIIDVDYEKKEEAFMESINSFCENKNELELFKRMMLDYNNLISDNVH